MSDYESDEAPEAVDFTTSKKLVLDEVKAAAEAIKQSKQKQKDTWKKRDEANKQQKVEKEARLQELKNSAPSDDIFDQLPEQFHRQAQPSRSTKLPTLTQYTEENVSDEDDKLEELDDETYLSLNVKKRKVKRVKLREEEYGSTKFRIMSSKDQLNSSHISESVLNFRKAKTAGHLSKVKRESAEERARRLAKLVRN